MRIEIVSFRLMLLASVTSLVVFGSLALHSAMQEKDMLATATAASKRWLDIAGPCQDWKDKADGSPRPLMCDHDEINELRERADTYFTWREEYSAEFELFRKFAVTFPLGSIFLFYSLRWAILGRIRPIWVRDA